MALKDVTCDTLGDVSEGEARKLVDRLLGMIKTDLMSRQHDSGVRKVVLNIEAFPAVDDDGEVDVTWRVTGKTTLPNFATKPTVSQLRASGCKIQTLFRDDNAARPDQPSFSDHGSNGE